jgi:hypothetical protein
LRFSWRKGPLAGGRLPKNDKLAKPEDVMAGSAFVD